MLTRRQLGWILPPSAAAMLAGIWAGRAHENLLFPLAACAAALLCVLFFRRRLRFAACVVLAFAIGSAAGCAAFHPKLPIEGEYSVTGVVSGEVTQGSFGQVRLQLSSVTLDGRPVSGGAYWTFYLGKEEELPEELLPGVQAVFQASLYHPEGADNPGGYNFRESLLRRGISFGLYGAEGLVLQTPESFSLAGFIASLRHRFSGALIRSLGEETGAYASALLLGMQSLIPSEEHEAFANLGIAHILSVSGFHVGLLIAGLALLFRLLRLKPGIRLAALSVLLAFYTALCGMSQPILRASLFALLTLRGRMLNRPRSGLHMLSAVMIGTMLLSPVQVTGASFVLTYAAMFGLLWLQPWASRLNLFHPRSLASRLFQSLVLVFGVQLAILVPELLYYQRLPVLSFVINLPATLVFSGLIGLYWLAFLLLPLPGLSALLAPVLQALTGGLLAAVRWLGRLPWLTLWLPSPNGLTCVGVLLVLLSVCALLRISGKRRVPLALLGGAILILSLQPLPHTATEYIQFSVSNADAALLWDQDQLIVIDTGTETGELSGFLRSRRLTPDLVILTHLHSDHAGGLKALMQDSIPIRTICLPEGAEAQDIHPDMLDLLQQYRQAGTEIRLLSRGDVIPLRSGALAVLWPEKGRVRPGQDANHYCLVSRVTLKGSTMLLTGDLTGEYEQYAVAPADLLKAAHHGSAHSTSPEFLSTVHPRAILLSCKTEERTRSMMDRCEGIPVWSTADCGALTVRFEEGGFTVSSFLTPTVSGGT